MSETKALAIITLLVSIVLCGGARSVAAEELEANAGWSGAGFLVQEKWGVLGVNVTNRSSKDADVLVSNRFDAAATVQYAQQVWVPANASRRLWQPVRMPSLMAEELRNEQGGVKRDVAIPLQTLALKIEGTQEIQVGRYDGVVRLENGTQPTGVIADSEDDASYDAISCCRLAADAGLGPRLASMRPSEVPSFGAGLSVLDTLLISRDDPGLDPAQMSAVRNWLLDGGRMWVMAEQVSPAFMEKLLGDDWSIRIVDHTRLSSVRIDGRGSDDPAPVVPLSARTGKAAASKHESPDETRYTALTFEKPIDFARAVVTEMEVLHTVNGWPAMVRRQVGRGWLYVSFVGPEGMYSVIKPSPRVIKPVPPIEWFASEFFRPATPAPLKAANFVNYLRQEIGHKIIGRTIVVALLGGFAFVLLAGGLVLAKQGRLERIGLVGAVGAIVVTAALLTIGTRHRSQRPLMTVSTHLAEVAPAQNVAIITGELGVYSPIDGMGPLRSLHGGVAWPDVRGQDGKILRMMFKDFDQWEWQNLSLPAGDVRASDVSHLVRLPKTPRVTATLSESGASAVFEPGEVGTLDDMLLATTGGLIAPRTDKDGRFEIADEQTLPQGQYMAAGIQDQVQSRRQMMYKTLMERGNYPERPTLLGWSGNVKIGIDLIQECKRVNSALVTIPLAYEPVKPGTTVSVPSLLMTRGKARVWQAQSAPLEKISNEEQGLTMDMRFAAKFFPPAAATPMTVSDGTLTIDLRAPGRPVEVYALPQGEQGPQVLLAKLDGPTLPVKIPLGKVGGIECPRDGGVVVVVSVLSSEGADPTDPTSLKPWRIRDLRLSVKGTVHE